MVPQKVWTGRGDGLCKSFRAMIVIAIAMRRSAGGTQQVLVPLQVSIAAEDTRSPGAVTIRGPDPFLVRTCPSPVLGGESLIFSKTPKPQPSPASSAYDTEASAAYQHAQLNTSHSGVSPRRYVPCLLGRPWGHAQGCTEPQDQAQIPRHPELLN